MTWIYNNEPLDTIPPNAIGFVYLIKNTSNQKLYIGKKQFYCTKTVYRKKVKKRIKAESNWREYCGSNCALLEDIAGGNSVEKQILHICYSKSECSYLEATEQFARNVLLDELYYNDWISVRVTAKHLAKYRARLEGG